MKIAVIIPAAGKSKRFGEADKSKLDLDLNGQPVFIRTIELFIKRPEVTQMIVAVDPDNLDTFNFRWGDKLGFLGVTVVPGGLVERWETVKNAINAINDDVTHIAVHDAARPVADAAMIDRVFEAGKQYSAVIPATPISATIKRIEKTEDTPVAEVDPLDAILGSAGKIEVNVQRVTDTIPRDGLWTVETPQLFDAALLKSGYDKIENGELPTEQLTDDAGLIELLGGEVFAVEGDSMNVKITYPADYEFAKAVYQMRHGKGESNIGSKRKFPTWAESEDD